MSNHCATRDINSRAAKVFCSSLSPIAANNSIIISHNNTIIHCCGSSKPLNSHTIFLCMDISSIHYYTRIDRSSIISSSISYSIYCRSIRFNSTTFDSKRSTISHTNTRRTCIRVNFSAFICNAFIILTNYRLRHCSAIIKCNITSNSNTPTCRNIIPVQIDRYILIKCYVTRQCYIFFQRDHVLDSWWQRCSNRRRFVALIRNRSDREQSNDHRYSEDNAEDSFAFSF